MNREDAWKIIEANVGFNIQYWPSGMNAEEKAVLTNRKKALANAWAFVGGLDATPSAPQGERP